METHDSLTPLFIACMCGFVDCVQHLLEGGATANFKGSDSQGPSALDLICRSENADIGIGDGPTQSTVENIVEDIPTKKRKIAQVNNGVLLFLFVCFCFFVFCIFFGAGINVLVPST